MVEVIIERRKNGTTTEELVVNTGKNVSSVEKIAPYKFLEINVLRNGAEINQVNLGGVLTPDITCQEEVTHDGKTFVRPFWQIEINNGVGRKAIGPDTHVVVNLQTKKPAQVINTKSPGALSMNW